MLLKIDELKKSVFKISKSYQNPQNFNKFDNFSKYTRRQTIARFLARYEIFKKTNRYQVGLIIECGVNEGMGFNVIGSFLSNFRAL